MPCDEFESVHLDTILAREEPAAEFVDPGTLRVYRALPAVGRVVTIAERHANRKRLRLYGRYGKQAGDSQDTSAARARPRAIRVPFPTHLEATPCDRPPVYRETELQGGTTIGRDRDSTANLAVPIAGAESPDQSSHSRHSTVYVGEVPGRDEYPMRYVSFIHQDEAGYGVSFPDYPGCVSVGDTVDDTVDDAVRLGREALAFHVEGLQADGTPIPPPRSIDTIKADPDLAEWRRGADFVLVPLLLDRGSSRRVNISLDRGLLEAIDDEAKQRRMTRSAFLSTAARNEIEGT